MTFASASEMRNSQGLQQRIIACAAQEGVDMPEQWVMTNIWKIIARPEWIARWDDAVFNYNPTYHPDAGARPDVISDTHILGAVQAVIAELAS